VPAQTLHLRPTAELADRALLPGDPGRALALAQTLLSDPLMFNHHRGLWGYTGLASDGRPLTIQSTGMGGPSAAIVLEELATLGLRRGIRVGTCGALEPGLALGDLIVAYEAIAADGTSRALGAGERAAADTGISEALARADRTRAGTVVSTDLFYDPDPERNRPWRDAGALAVEMEAATLFAVAQRRDLRVGAILAVSDRFGPDGRERIEDEMLLAVAESMGAIAVAALAEA
jgi:DeoD family purine-nucleoside phosphorylase